MEYSSSRAEVVKMERSAVFFNSFTSPSLLYLSYLTPIVCALTIGLMEMFKLFNFKIV